jgi:hypothetical protein
MQRAHLRCSIGLCFILCCQSTLAERPWRAATSAHYEVLSQLDDRATADWMRDFDQFIAATSGVLQMDLRSLPPLTVVLFDRDKDYAPFKLQRPNGETANVAGQFILRPTASLIAMALEGDSPELRRTLQHEATHWLMSADQTRQPAWFAEGIADMFSTFERHADKVDWAKPIDSHLAVLRRSGTEPLAQFLVEPSAVFDRDDHMGHFYAQAWAFTHFLLLDPTRRALLLKFLETYRTESGETTVERVFGPQLKDIEHDFRLYIERPKLNYMVQPAKSTVEPPPLRPASAQQVEASLGLLALGAHRLELAQQHAAKAVELDPNASDGDRVLAYLERENHEMGKAAQHAQAAIDHGSKDGGLYVLLGDAYATGPLDEKPDAAQERVKLYEKAINLSPHQADFYERLTDALFSIEKPRDEDEKFLNVGLRLFPGNDWLRVGTAVVDSKLGRQQVAMATLDTVLRPQSTLDPSQRSYAASQRRRWLLETMRSEIDSAEDKNDFAGARAVIVRYRERVGEDADTATYLTDLEKSLQLRELLAKYNAALHARNKAEIRASGQSLLALPDLPQNIRDSVQQQLRRP